MIASKANSTKAFAVVVALGRRGHHLLAAVLVVLLMSTALPATAAAGDMDATFGAGGKVSTDFGSISLANAVAETTAGRVVAVGQFGEVSTSDFALARYVAKGALDPTFGSGGKVTTSFTDDSDVARAVAVQADGKIVVGGIAGDKTPPAALVGDFALARYNAAGTLDKSFGVGGKVTTDLSGGLGDGIRSVAILPKGRILAVGAAGPYIGLVRYKPDGRLDGSFGDGGKVVVRIGNSGHAFALALLDSGQFLIAGRVTNILSQSDFLLARFSADGSLDPTFARDGFLTTDFSGLNDLAFGLTVQPDGKIVVVGSANSLHAFGADGDVEFGIARYATNGALDRSFGSGGKVRINPTPLPDGLRGVVIGDDGTIVAGGFIGEARATFLDPMIGDFGLTRLTAEGKPDTSFGDGGVAKTDFAASGDGGRAVILRANNRILVVGGATTNHLNFALAQYMGT